MRARIPILLLLIATAAFAQAPRVDSITPPQGPIAGGTLVTIAGANLDGGVVTVDGALVGPAITSASQIQVAMPPHVNGYAYVRVLSNGGTATTTFLYMPPALRDLPPGFITTVAGVGTYWGDYRPAVDAVLAVPGQFGYAIDGTLYISDIGHRRLVRVRPDGILEPYSDLVLGNAISMMVEPSGDIEVADSAANRIWRVSVLTGKATLLAGTGDAGFSGDGGPATAAQLNAPTFVAGDRLGTIWFLDSGNARIRRIDPDGTITTICGTGTRGYSGDDNAAINATFDTGNGTLGNLAIDAANHLLYFADNGNQRIRRIELTHNIVSTFLGPAPDTTYRAIIVAPNGDLFVNANDRILHLRRDGTTLELFGANVTAFGFDLDHDGNLFYGDVLRNRIVRLEPTVHAPAGTVAGGNDVFGENGPATAAAPIDTAGIDPDVAINQAGEVVFSGAVIHRIGLDGNLSVAAALSAAGIDVDAAGNLDAATFNNVTQVDRAGNARVVAGGAQPSDVVADRGGNLFVADATDNVIRRVDATTHAVSLVAGNGTNSFCGDGGLATNACLGAPAGVAVDGAGDLFIAESGHLRKVDRGGRITTLVGIEGKRYLATDVAGSVYSVTNNGVFRANPAGTVQRLAGRTTGERGFSGDGGPATDATMLGGGGVAIDGEGNLYFVDGGNGRIRAVRYGAVLAPANAKISAAASGATIRATVVDASGVPAPSVRVDFAAPVSGATCALSSPFAITDANGVATVTCTPNCVRGAYAVTATPLASAANASVTMANVSCHQRATRH